MSLAQHIVKRPVLGIVIFGLVAIVAVYLLSGIAIDMFPETSSPVLSVSTGYSGAGPETVEKTVTKLLESQLVNLSGLTNMTSTSSEGSSVIRLEFAYGSNLDAKINDIRDRLDRIKGRLPDGAGTPSIMQFDMNSSPIMNIAVRGANRDANELRAIAVGVIQDRLEQVDGVASTSVNGGREQLVQVEIALNRLEAYGLTITGIASSLAAANIELGAGSIVDGSKNYNIRTTGEFTSLQDIAETVIARRSGADIRLLDVGTVALTYPNETSAVYINGENSVYVSVTKQSGANSAAVADRVYAKLKEIEKYLPGDVSLEITQDNTTQIRDMMSEMVNSAVLGGILAIGILFLFLRNIKSTVIIGISIPFSLLVTLLLMNLTGVTLNMISMAGLILGIGMIVDSSIVILENIYKHRERGAKPTVAAVLGGGEVMSSIISSTLTTLCVFVPIFLFKNTLGMQGQMLQQLIFSVGISLASSLLVAIFLVPILASTYLPLNTRKQKPLKNRLLRAVDDFFEGAQRGLNRGYRRLLAGALNHRFLTVLLVAAAFTGSVLCLLKLPLRMMPSMNENSVSLSVTLPRGTLYENTKAVMLQLQEIALDELNGIKTITVNIGSGGRGGGGSGSSHQGSLSVTLDMNDPDADTSARVQQKLRAHFADFPNASLSFGAGWGRMLSGGADIDLALHIDDIDTGLAAAGEIKELINANMPELSELSIDLTEGLPQVEVIIDRKRAANLGLSVSSIARELSAAMNGLEATTFRSLGNEYAVTLKLREEDRQKLPDLNRIFVSSGAGNLIPLSNFATMEKSLGPVSISRENQSRIIHVTGNLVDGSGAREAEEKIRSLLDSNYILPEGVSISYEGQWGEINKTIQTYLLIITLAVLLVFGVMAGQYESFKDPFINLCTIPLMLIGVVGVYLITGQVLSVFSLVGLVMLAGIVVNNGIVLVDYTNLLAGRGMPVREACLDAGESRLRPVLMTTLTTVLGLIPMAFFPGNSALMIQPIGLTVLGGLVSSTVITLFFIPVMYSLVNEGRRNRVRNQNEAPHVNVPPVHPVIATKRRKSPAQAAPTVDKTFEPDRLF
ncbi:MAG: efflux RND transporter permease subunit [Treponema sp.]|jgi:HAE1 family hydrophobic/amphiphilic exporter-1|nr:efflux RND transporter permease subunit [Treponema sp.]